MGATHAIPALPLPRMYAGTPTRTMGCYPMPQTAAGGSHDRPQASLGQRKSRPQLALAVGGQLALLAVRQGTSQVIQ